MAKYLREHKNKFEDHGNKTTVKEIEIKSLKHLQCDIGIIEGRGGAREFVYRGLMRNNRKLELNNENFLIWNNGTYIPFGCVLME